MSDLLHGPWPPDPLVPPRRPIDPDKPPPHNIEAEEGVLGSILLNNACLDEIRAGMNPDDFYRDRHTLAFLAMIGLREAGRPIDGITLADELTRRGESGRVGGDEFIAKLCNSVPHGLNGRYYADMVHQKAIARRAADVARETLVEVYSETFTGEELAARLRRRAGEIDALVSTWDAPVLDGIPAAREFPLEVLPPELARLAVEVGESIPCPPDFTAIPCLAVASGVIGRSVSVRVKDSWFELCNGWFVTVAPPGRAKSPGVEFAQKPIWKIQRELLHTHEVECAIAAAARAAKAKGPIPAPVLGRIKAIDATVESLPPILAENPRGLVVVLDELAHMMNGLNQYKSAGRGNDAQMWLSLWNRAPLMIDRKSNEGRIPISVPEPFVSLVGPMTPSMLDRVVSPNGGPRRDDGFFDRFLFGFPSKIRRRWVDESVSHGAEAAWDDAVRRLWNLPLKETTTGRPRPYWLDLTRDARECYKAWHDAQWEETELPDFPSDSEGPMAKWTAYALRLCLLLHQLHWAYDPFGPLVPPPIEVESMERAIRLMAYFRAHYDRVLATVIGCKATNPDAEEILRWAGQRESREFSQADAKDCFRRRFANDPEKLPEALGWLEERNFIRRLPVRKSHVGGRLPGPRFELHPSFSGCYPEKRAPNAPN